MNSMASDRQAGRMSKARSYIRLVGIALAFFLPQLNLRYQFGIYIVLPQLGVFLSACSGGALWGLLAGLAGGVGYYMLQAGVAGQLALNQQVHWLVVLPLVGLMTGFLSSRMRPVYASSLSWILLGIPTSFLVVTYLALPSQALYAWLMSGTYESILSAVSVDILLAAAHVERRMVPEPTKEVKRSEAHAEVGF